MEGLGGRPHCRHCGRRCCNTVSPPLGNRMWETGLDFFSTSYGIRTKMYLIDRHVKNRQEPKLKLAGAHNAGNDALEIQLKSLCGYRYLEIRYDARAKSTGSGTYRIHYIIRRQTKERQIHSGESRHEQQEIHDLP